MRITRPLAKAAYVIAGYAALVVAARLTDSLPPLAFAIVDFSLNFAYVGFGVRTFRGKYEAVAPPRPWWRMTGRPKAGFWLAALNLLGVIGFVFDRYPDNPVYLLESVAIGLLYLNSSIRLVRIRITSVETTPREPTVPRAYRVTP